MRGNTFAAYNRAAALAGGAAYNRRCGGPFSLPQISGLLKAVDSMMSVLLGIILMVGAMFVISLAVVVSTGRAR